jgi:hypothetical protein
MVNLRSILTVAAAAVFSIFFAERREALEILVPVNEKGYMVMFDGTSCRGNSLQDQFLGVEGQSCEALASGNIGGIFYEAGLGLEEAWVTNLGDGQLLYFHHGLPEVDVEVPPGYKLVSCYCDQPECLIATDSPLYVDPIRHDVPFAWQSNLPHSEALVVVRETITIYE